MGSMKVWDGTAWQTASAGTSLPPVTSVDGRTGAVSLSDLYLSAYGNWIAYTPTFATDTNPSGAGMTPGTGGSCVGMYRMVAPYSMALRMRFTFGSTGGNGGVSGNFIFSIPAGYGTAVDNYQYMTCLAYSGTSGHHYLGLVHVYANDVWMRPCSPNASPVQDVVGSQYQIHTSGSQHPPGLYPNGVCAIWGVINVAQRS